jgi:hypothetical protein
MQIKIVTLDVRLSENTKRTIRWVLLPIAVLAGSMAVARAYNTTWIMSGQSVSAASLKGNLDEIQTRLAALENGTKGVVITAWQGYTPVLQGTTGTPVAAATSSGKYRRVGDSLEVSIRTSFQATPTGTSGNNQYYQWTLPSGLAVDQTKVSFAYVGGGSVQGPTLPSLAVLSVATYASTTVSAQADNVWWVNDTAPYSFGSGFAIDLWFTVPIAGWSATQ